MTSTTSTKNDMPLIYVACLAAYNNGRLHGEWIDATADPDNINEKIEAMLKASPEPGAEEFAIHDHGGFEGFNLGEWTPIKEVQEIALFIQEHGKLGAKVMHANGCTVAEAAVTMEEQYRGEFKSLDDFAAELYEECYEIPEFLQNYIDYEAIARDMERNGEIFTIELGYQEIHVFWST